MSTPIGDQLALEHHHGQRSISDIRAIWHDLTGTSHNPSYHDTDNTPREPAMTSVDTLKTDLDNVLEAHRGEIETALNLATQVATNPVAQVAVAGLTHIPANVLADEANRLATLDAEFARLLPPPAEPDPNLNQPV